MQIIDGDPGLVGHQVLNRGEANTRCYPGNEGRLA
jgi:hypothetical protein